MAWTAIADWPGNASGPSWAVGDPSAGGKVYAGGGRHVSTGLTVNENFVYDPDTNAWTALTAASTGRWDAPWAVYVSGLIYVGGGSNDGGALDSVEVYSVATNTWSSRASMPAAASLCGAARYGGTLYVFIGNALSGTKVFAYAIASNAWSQITPSSAKPGVYRATTVGDLIYTTGDTVLRAFDPLAEDWTTAAFTSATTFPVNLATIGTQLIAWAEASPATDDVYVWTPPGGEPTLLGETPPFEAGDNLPATGDTLYLLPKEGSASDACYMLGVEVLGGSVTTARDVIGDFRHRPRWPELARRAVDE